MWVLLDDLFGYDVIGLQFQPSLSLLDPLQTTFRAASAFFLQAFTQSCIMVGCMPDSFPWVKGRLACRGRSHRQIANTHIDSDDFSELLMRRLRHVDFQRHE